MCGQMAHLGKAAQDGEGSVRGEHFSLWQDMPPNVPGQDQLGNYCEAMLSHGVWEKKKVCWSPQVIPKISLLKLLTGLTDTTPTSVVPQLPARCRHQVHISHP